MALAFAFPVHAQQSAARTILAIGAHAGDMELTAGAVLAKQRETGDRVVLLHLTLDERGSPKRSAEIAMPSAAATPAAP